MNILVKKTGIPRSLVYTGKECLMIFPTNQQAWEYLSELSIISDEKKEPWPEEVHVAFMIEEVGDAIMVPQIQKVSKQEDGLYYVGLFGPEYNAFRRRIVDDWPTIKEGLVLG